MTSAVGGRQLLLQWLARPMFLVSRVVDDRPRCRRECHAGHACIRRLVPLVEHPSQTARFMLGARLNVYTGSIGRGSGLADVVGRGARGEVEAESGTQSRGTKLLAELANPTIHLELDGPSTVDGTCSVRPCPPVPTCARLYSGQANQRRLPPIRNRLGKNSRGGEGVEGGVPPPAPRLIALLGRDSIWEHMASRGTHTHTSTPANRVQQHPILVHSSQSVPRFVQRRAG
ncbi:hypothetical protein QBC39DRAFT_435788 [Podospora conica]|nr:hypothetical protein QBC39DRAFT_435788 [Schizothecium conicum]